jgi:hypothetical protein
MTLSSMWTHSTRDLRRQAVSQRVLVSVVLPTLAVSLTYLTVRAPVAESVSIIGFGMASLTYIPNALALIVEEQDRVASERDALLSFGQRLSNIEPHSSPSITQPGPSLESHLDTNNRLPRNQLQEVQQAYRETVMAVPHYEEEYGKSLATDLGEEFTDEIAIAVTTNEQFTAPLKTALLQQVTDSHQERIQLLQDLDDEQTGLEQAEQTMGQVDDSLQEFDETRLFDESIPTLQDRYERFCAYKEQCITVIEQRQQYHHKTPRRWLDGEVGDLQWYLYDDLPVQYPVLADGATLIEQIETAQQEVAATLGKINA